jgi:hypothetical protein
VDKLDIFNEMKQFDNKNRDFYDELNDEEKKKFSTFLMIRWGSSVNGDSDLQTVYLEYCNENLNKHFFTLHKHPKLQWLMATSVSPGLGSHRHNWIKTKKKEGGSTPHRKTLAELYPNMKEDELDLMAEINTKKDVDTLLKSMGREIKK